MWGTGDRAKGVKVVMRAAAALIVCALALGGCGSTDSAQTNSLPSDEASGAKSSAEGSGASCVSSFTLAGLAERAFAFDGTVVEVMSEIDPKLEDDESGQRPQPRALFEVSEWFAGGTEPTVLVWLQRDAAVGDRLLVSGEPRWGGEPLDDAIQWECGWTMEHSEADASAWRAATAA